MHSTWEVNRAHGDMVPRQEQSIQEIINQQLLLQEQLRPLAEGLMGHETWGN